MVAETNPQISYKQFLILFIFQVSINTSQQDKIIIIDKSKSQHCKKGLLAGTDQIFLDVSVELEGDLPRERDVLSFFFYNMSTNSREETKFCYDLTNHCSRDQHKECYCRLNNYSSWHFIVNVTAHVKYSKNRLISTYVKQASPLIYSTADYILPTIHDKVGSPRFRVDGGMNLLSRSMCSENISTCGVHKFEFCVEGLLNPYLTMYFHIFESPDTLFSECITKDIDIETNTLYVNLNYTEDCKGQVNIGCVIHFKNCAVGDPVTMTVDEGTNLFSLTECSATLVIGVDHTLKFCRFDSTRGQLVITKDGVVLKNSSSDQCLTEVFPIYEEKIEYKLYYIKKPYKDISYKCTFYGFFDTTHMDFSDTTLTTHCRHCDKGSSIRWRFAIIVTTAIAFVAMFCCYFVAKDNCGKKRSPQLYVETKQETGGEITKQEKKKTSTVSESDMESSVDYLGYESDRKPSTYYSSEHTEKAQSGNDDDDNSSGIKNYSTELSFR